MPAGELTLYRDYKLTDVSEYASAAGKKGGKKGGKKDAKPETKKASNYALNPKNKDGHDSKWQHSSRVSKLSRAPRTNCITCKMVPRAHSSDKCNQCQLAVLSALGLTASPRTHSPPRHRRLLFLSAVGVVF
jgi:hypothetical protein